MNPLNWRHYAGIGFHLAQLVYATVKAARDGKLTEQEWADISVSFRGAIEELLRHVATVWAEDEAKRLNP